MIFLEVAAKLLPFQESKSSKLAINLFKSIEVSLEAPKRVVHVVDRVEPLSLGFLQAVLKLPADQTLTVSVLKHNNN